VAFGGAGPLHACQVAEELGMRRVIAPGAAGMLAAAGLVVAGERRDRVQSVLLGAGERERLARWIDELWTASARELPGALLEVSADCRYAGQSHSLTVAVDPDRLETIGERFHEAHRRRYGDAAPDRPVEVVSLRVGARRPGAEPELAGGPPVRTLEGPELVPMDGATCWVATGWRAEVGADGAVVMERG